MSPPHVIPQEKLAAVTRGLLRAFGVTECEDIRELAGGLGANPVFRIVVRGSAYLLRINQRAGDVARQFTCMNAAAEAGAAPRVWYTSVDDRVAITDFVETRPFPAPEALRRIPALLRTLHALPLFPEAPKHINTSCTFLLNKGPALDRLLQKIRADNTLPKNGTQELLARYEQVASVYAPAGGDMVSCHNDLFKPDNMLFDGDRLWLVDWEAAFPNDRYADLAVVANLVVTNDAEERAFLQEYFEQPPDEFQLARLFLMRQIAHMFYTMAFLLLGGPGNSIDWNEPVPGYEDFHRRFWAGEIKLTDNQTKTIYGRVHWERLLRNVGQARYNEARRIVSERHAIA